MKCFNNRWVRCRNSRLWTSHYYTPYGYNVHIEDALLYPDSTRTLLSYRDIHKNRYHIETHHQNNEEFLLIT